MTETTKQVSTRFAKLDAIPRHTPMTGFKAIVARIYVARRMSASIAAAATFAIVAAVVGVQAVNETGHGETVSAEVKVLMPPAKTESSGPAPRTDETGTSAIAAAIPSGDTSSVTKIDAGLDLYKPSTDTLPEPAAAQIQQLEEVAAESKGRDASSVQPELVDVGHSKGEPSTEQPVKDARENPAAPTLFSLPSEGVPTESDIATFLVKPSGDAAAAVDTKVEAEDMTPTVALPESAPLPQARPDPVLAKGTKVEFHIAQGSGQKSGFWLGNKTDPTARRFFVVVRPQLESGDLVRWKFTNIADGTLAETDKLAIEVTEDAFVSLAKEAKEFGQVRNPVLGRGAVGDSDVKWRIKAVGDNMIAGWEGEAGK